MFNSLTPFLPYTGLDPVEPYFQGTDAAVHLDIGDAAFVDVIHTNGRPFDSKLGKSSLIPLKTMKVGSVCSFLS